jgi:hypothetical protein
MKITKHILPVFYFAICALLLASPTMAQETNNPTTNSEAAALETTNEATTNETGLSDQNDEGRDNPQPIVLFGQNAELKAGETADSVVVIGGSAIIHGKVRHEVVVIDGDLEVDGEVGDAAVAIFGNVHAKPGAVIHQETVAVMGGVAAEPGVKINGNAVAVGGKLDIADGAIVKGEKVNVGLPGPLSNIDWLRDWFKYCAFEFRPLAPQLGFVWIIAGIFFLVYLCIAAVFPRPVQVCVDDLNKRPATLFLLGLLTKLLVAFVYLILTITGVGLVVVPVIWAVLFICAVVGKVAILEWLGFKVGRHFGKGFQKPLAAFLLGTIIITLLYVVPVLGLLVYIILSVWGLGCGITAALGCLRRERPENPEPPATPVASAPASTFGPPIIDSNTPPPETGILIEPSAASGTMPQNAFQPQPSVSAPPVVPDTSSFPKATLWERLCAAILDIILVSILVSLAHFRPFPWLIVALAYFTGMWTWQGTTIGGIVLKLKVVRADGRPLTFVVALVRGLAAAFGAVVFFLGFLWITWDKDKQGWHDKIAGTQVIRLPHSTPLVLL